jgi:hypothetical protein
MLPAMKRPKSLTLVEQLGLWVGIVACVATGYTLKALPPLRWLSFAVAAVCGWMIGRQAWYYWVLPFVLHCDADHAVLASELVTNVQQLLERRELIARDWTALLGAYRDMETSVAELGDVWQDRGATDLALNVTAQKLRDRVTWCMVAEVIF